MTVQYHGHVVVDEGPSLRHDHHLQISARLDDHLASVAPALVVALYAEGAHGLHPGQVTFGVVVVVDDGLTRRFSPVQNRARGEESRPELQAGLDHLRVREHHRGVVRRIVGGGHTESEVGHERPTGLPHDPGSLPAHVCVYVDEPGNDGLARRVHPVSIRGDGDPVPGPDIGDRVRGHHDRAVLDQAAVFARLRGECEYAGSHEGDRAGRYVAVLSKSDRDPPRFGLSGFGRRTGSERERFGEVPSEIFGPQGPEERLAVARPVEVQTGVLGDAFYREAIHVRTQRDRSSGPGESGDVGTVAFREGDPSAVGRRDDFGGVF